MDKYQQIIKTHNKINLKQELYLFIKYTHNMILLVPTEYSTGIWNGEECNRYLPFINSQLCF